MRRYNIKKNTPVPDITAKDERRKSEAYINIINVNLEYARKNIISLAKRTASGE